MQLIKIIKISVVLSTLVFIISCSSDIKRTPTFTYMPDMYYSRAYETYSSTEYLKAQGINFVARPVKGTISRDEMLPLYPLENTPEGYEASAKIQSPIITLSDAELKEAERLFLINCAICHGDKLDGNGPLYKGGEGPYPAKPASLVGDEKYENMAEGTIFHAIRYGKNLMGSYASQLNTKQAWMVVRYIKTKQTKK